MRLCLSCAIVGATVALGLPGAGSCASASRITMHRVQLYNFDDAAVSIEDLDGALEPSKREHIVDLNDVNSYRIGIRSAVVTIPQATMNILMNRFILPRAGSPLSDLDMVFDRGVIRLRGKVPVAGLKLGFKADAVPFVTPTGDVGMRIQHLKTAGFIPSSVSNALGMTLERMAKPARPGVMDVHGDVMTISVASTFPAPALSGRLAAISVTPNGLATRIGNSRASGGPPAIRITGGPVRFAHLIMPQAKLLIQPVRKQSDFGFSPRRYYQQMVAGTSKATPDFGLIGWFGDFRDIHRGASSKSDRH